MDKWQLDDDRELRVSLISYRGRWRVDARIWLRAEDGAPYPGKGLALGVEHVERLAAAVEKACRGAVARDLIVTAPAAPEPDDI